MNTFDFDEPVVRRGTGCYKWDETAADGVIPMWVADMDFRVAPAIRRAVEQRARHGVFGYTFVGDDYYDAVISWFGRRHQWHIRREEILYTTGVVPAMSVAIKALAMPGEKVLILSPDYNCFFSSIRNNGCEVAESALLFDREANRYVVDWDDFERQCADTRTTLFLLCNPHNPTGRVWTLEELERMNTLCQANGVKVVSDEIHCELVMPGHRFTPFAAVSDACRQNAVTLNSPSKSFNIAGLQTANIISARPDWRRRLDRAININEVCDLNPFGPVALIAAYNDSEAWLDALVQYIWENYCALRDFMADALPQFEVRPMEGTYLPWVDVSDIGVAVEQLCERLLNEGKVRVNPGTMYGANTGQGYIRLNIACPRELMMEGLRRIKAVIG